MIKKLFSCLSPTEQQQVQHKQLINQQQTDYTIQNFFTQKHKFKSYPFYIHIQFSTQHNQFIFDLDKINNQYEVDRSDMNTMKVKPKKRKQTQISNIAVKVEINKLYIGGEVQFRNLSVSFTINYENDWFYEKFKEQLNEKVNQSGQSLKKRKQNKLPTIYKLNEKTQLEQWMEQYKQIHLPYNSLFIIRRREIFRYVVILQALRRNRFDKKQLRAMINEIPLNRDKYRLIINNIMRDLKIPLSNNEDINVKYPRALFSNNQLIANVEATLRKFHNSQHRFKIYFLLEIEEQFSSNYENLLRKYFIKDIFNLWENGNTRIPIFLNLIDGLDKYNKSDTFSKKIMERFKNIVNVEIDIFHDFKLLNEGQIVKKIQQICNNKGLEKQIESKIFKIGMKIDLDKKKVAETTVNRKIQQIKQMIEEIYGINCEIQYDAADADLKIQYFVQNQILKVKFGSSHQIVQNKNLRPLNFLQVFELIMLEIYPKRYEIHKKYQNKNIDDKERGNLIRNQVDKKKNKFQEKVNLVHDSNKQKPIKNQQSNPIIKNDQQGKINVRDSGYKNRQIYFNHDQDEEEQASINFINQGNKKKTSIYFNEPMELPYQDLEKSTDARSPPKKDTKLSPKKQQSQVQRKKQKQSIKKQPILLKLKIDAVSSEFYTKKFNKLKEIIYSQSNRKCIISSEGKMFLEHLVHKNQINLKSTNYEQNLATYHIKNNLDEIELEEISRLVVKHYTSQQNQKKLVESHESLKSTIIDSSIKQILSNKEKFYNRNQKSETKLKSEIIYQVPDDDAVINVTLNKKIQSQRLTQSIPKIKANKQSNDRHQEYNKPKELRQYVLQKIQKDTKIDKTNSNQTKNKNVFPVQNKQQASIQKFQFQKSNVGLQFIKEKKSVVVPILQRSQQKIEFKYFPSKLKEHDIIISQIQKYIKQSQKTLRTSITIILFKNMHDRGGLDLFDSQIQYRFKEFSNLLQDNTCFIVNLSPSCYLTSKVLKQRLLQKSKLFGNQVLDYQANALALEYNLLKKEIKFKTKQVRKEFQKIVDSFSY